MRLYFERLTEVPKQTEQSITFKIRNYCEQHKSRIASFGSSFDGEWLMVMGDVTDKIHVINLSRLVLPRGCAKFETCLVLFLQVPTSFIGEECSSTA